VAEPGVVRRIVIPGVLLVLTALGLFNTYADASDVQALAARTACGGTGCSAQMVEFTKSPFSHEYVFQTQRDGTRVQVKCARAFVFVGDYACERR
jgi:hypothetical protein